MGKLAKFLRLGVHGGVSVELEEDKLRPGDAVTGTVYLRLTKPMNAQLTVCVRGEQKLRWSQQNGQHKTPYSIVLRHLELTEVLAARDSAFEEGDIDLEDVRVTIEYAVDAALLVDAFTTANMDSSTTFTVDLPPNAFVVAPKPVVVQQETVVKLLGILKRGTCRVALELPCDVFDATSTIEARVTFHLQTTRRLKFVVLALNEDATVDRQRQRRLKQGSRFVCCRRFEASTLGDCTTAPFATTLRLPITPNDIFRFDALTPTLQTHFLTLNFSVSVDCHFAKAPKVRIVVPVTIVPVDTTRIAAAAAT